MLTAKRVHLQVVAAPKGLLRVRKPPSLLAFGLKVKCEVRASHALSVRAEFCKSAQWPQVFLEKEGLLDVVIRI